jgi:hypothetical protein
MKKQSNYQLNVLSTNVELKKELKSLGGCRALLLNNSKEIKLSPKFAQILRQSKKDENLYKFLVNNVRTSKSGNYSPFYLLQFLHKFTESKDFKDDLIKFNIVKLASIENAAK